MQQRVKRQPSPIEMPQETDVDLQGVSVPRRFYEALGFTAFFGDEAKNWLILKNGAHVIGLFQGMFDKNILSFNPGWSGDAKPLGRFTDIRELQRQLKKSGIPFLTKADEQATGPASFMLADPDGNTILVDQHV